MYGELLERRKKEEGIREKEEERREKEKGRRKEEGDITCIRNGKSCRLNGNIPFNIVF